MTKSQTHETHVDRQFGPRADAYVTSAVHASGEDLDALEDIVRRARPANAIDLGAGGGHVAYRLAPHAGRVVAVDLSADMLVAVAATAQAKGFANFETRAAAAEALPFADGTFDFLGCRFSAHHWGDFEGGLREARRVLAAGATAVFVDVVSPGPPPLDTHLQAVELLRDTSHVRDYSGAEWQGALAHAGFAIGAMKWRRLRMDYPVWIGRMRTPAANATAIRALQAAATEGVVRHFEIEQDGSFTVDSLMIEAVAA